MMKKDILGHKFNRLTATKFLGVNGYGHEAWEFLCECGNTTQATMYHVVRGTTKSCGCLSRETSSRNATIRNLTHGLTIGGARTVEYDAWSSMKGRCLNPLHLSYHRYGGRGIKVCDRWLNSFEAFLSDMGLRPKGHTLERVQRNGNYEPSNCIWATPKVQGRNRDVNIYIEIDGRT